MDKDALHDLALRLANAEATCIRLAGTALTEQTRTRLYGKAQGLKVALGFVEEALR